LKQGVSVFTIGGVLGCNLSLGKGSLVSGKTFKTAAVYRMGTKLGEFAMVGGKSNGANKGIKNGIYLSIHGHDIAV
jgi:hypothetical protein